MASMEPLSPFVPLHGNDPSCGEFCVQLSKKTSRALPKIEVRFDRKIDSQRLFNRKLMRWYGNKPSVVDLNRLLESADVPACIQIAGALYLIIDAVDMILKECESHDLPLPSLLVTISSVMCTSSQEDEMIDEDEEY